MGAVVAPSRVRVKVVVPLTTAPEKVSVWPAFIVFSYRVRFGKPFVRLPGPPMLPLSVNGSTGLIAFTKFGFAPVDVSRMLLGRVIALRPSSSRDAPAVVLFDAK